MLHEESSADAAHVGKLNEKRNRKKESKRVSSKKLAYINPTPGP